MNYLSKYLFGIKQKSVLVENSLSPQTIDLIITSPPYNVGIDYSFHADNLTYLAYLKFSEIWLKNCYQWTKLSGRLCLNVPLDKNKNGKNSVAADITNLAKKVGWKYQTTIIWNEGNISRRTAWGSWMSAMAPSVIAPVEVILVFLVFYKEQWKKNQRGQSDITREEFMEWMNGLWTFGGENPKKVNHPAPFPRELPKRCIKLFSFVGDVVLDPFAGSGTTLIEAIQNKRYVWGLEIDPQYIKNSLQRIEKECRFSASKNLCPQKSLENNHDIKTDKRD
ncbi:MAG: site-specific DNA-methyltransferase [Candidatus Moeniiplasma glomeromycotorum]|nr:site-specific DNA-methyltransferase [Candidatus Moeniiplasma glomeromycotorum]MCE8167376.1 site-specific DNA-methyltransferase [Candidatus Moeniiplasma glomeromycotorum]MCE8168611.1 site-specific DNA-methyltransferase [Candidatus Moeniiplasma glomeromycotorum]